MIKTIEIGNSTEAIEQLTGLYEHFRENGDSTRVEKLEKLLKKIYHHDFIVAFCGHFSAGKSTMINALLGENVLPSSPIPTSANLVKIHKSSSDFAKVFYKDEAPYLFEAPYNFSKVKEFCKNGNVTEIEIGMQETSLPDGVTIMDTPGVDSTDDAHRISTESAIHLADTVFYVMDYNHVQSELNFLYTRELLQQGVELYLIINQIDKHNDEELSFSDFQHSVQESFSAWNVHPKGIFFTTLKKELNVHNQFKKVKSLVEELITQRESRFANSIQSSANLLIQEHFKWLREQEESQAQPYIEMVEHISMAERDAILAKEQEVNSKIDELQGKVKSLEKFFDDARKEILKNAYLMPYQTRELAEKFLESTQSDFKMGFLFSKKKTEEERLRRLEEFYKDINAQVESQLTWHMREFIGRILKDASLTSDQWMLNAQNLSINFDMDLLRDTVKKGARMSGEYVLHYCDDVAERLKKLAFQELENLKEQITINYQSEIEHEVIALQTELIYVKKLTDSIRSIDKLAAIRNEKEQRLFKPIFQFEEVYQKMQRKWQTEQSQSRIYVETNEMTEESKKADSVHSNPSYVDAIDMEMDSVQKTINKLSQAVKLLENKAGFGRITEHLQEKKVRIENKQFTIALFGAFSAGKSSFANALIGEKVLPVSPNPTTAAINRICPPNNQYSHGSAAVHLKNEKEMLEDVQKSLKEFNLNCGSLEEAERTISKIANRETPEAREKIHLSFLLAFANGYKVYKEKLGKDIIVGMEEFRGFVANESQSCFVESIDLYYDSELTRQGITLVDTPGADSINARHTGVSFEYIKNSDAILFVTYYNHAFSKADREFLIQLGRVKDAFELDKMFFIVNAIDLADSSEELDDVMTYVNDQLTQYGIRFPKLFGVSSLLAFKEQAKQSGLLEFKESFSTFLSQDLMKMSIQSANNEIQRVITMIDQLIETALESQEEKEIRKKLLLANQDRIHEILTQTSSEIFTSKLIQELKELLFYVKQRVFYRFTGFFKESFNPATLQNNNKEALNKALDELLESLGYDFAQEMRATSLRIENYIKELFRKRLEQFQGQVVKIQSSISISEYEIGAMLTPDFQPAFMDIDKSPLERTFKYFKNTKSFFEKNEKQLMEEELQRLLQPIADSYIENQKDWIEKYFNPFIDREFAKLINHIMDDIKDQFKALLTVLGEKVDIGEWTSIREKMIDD